MGGDGCAPVCVSSGGGADDDAKDSTTDDVCVSANMFASICVLGGTNGRNVATRHAFLSWGTCAGVCNRYDLAARGHQAD